MFKPWGSRFLVRQLMVFDVWVAVRDLNQGTKADLSARLRFQSSDQRLTLDCPKIEAVPLADCAWRRPSLCRHAELCFDGGKPLYEKLITRLPSVNSRRYSNE
jgi:hypothetical protein